VVVAGVVGLVLGVASAVVVVLAAAGVIAGSAGGYVCLSLCAVGFGAAGVALLAGSRVMPRGWPPRAEEPGATSGEAVQGEPMPGGTDVDGGPSSGGADGDLGGADEHRRPGSGGPTGGPADEDTT
jgi:hypothetical protein